MKTNFIKKYPVRLKFTVQNRLPVRTMNPQTSKNGLIVFRFVLIVMLRIIAFFKRAAVTLIRLGNNDIMFVYKERSSV